MAKRNYCYSWPRPAVTVDIVLFTVTGSLQNLRLRVLLIERGEQPFRGAWALPGGFVRQDEELQTAAFRELQEETGIAQVFLEQVAAIGTPGRDPRGHTVTILYVGLVAADRYQLASQGDAAAVRWFDLVAGASLPPLAFDHTVLLRQALTHLRRRVDETPALCAELLPERFTLSELQALVEAIAAGPLDRRNFRRKFKDRPDLLVPAEGTRREGRHRPAQLYRFVSPLRQLSTP
jgi:8-oxo-dGTP diphosphatase